MKLIIILLTMAVDHFLGDLLTKLKESRRFGWFHTLAGFLAKTFGAVPVWNGPVGVLATVALPLIVFTVVASFLEGITGIGILLGLLFSMVVLLYSLGPTDLGDEVAPIVKAIGENNDPEAARRAQELARAAEPIAPESRGRTLVESILVEANRRVFAVLCWFALLGWFGGLLFRLSSELRVYAAQAQPGFADFAKRLYEVLVWFPARVTALCYALGGNFGGAFKSWRMRDTLGLAQSEQVLKDSGLGSLQFDTVTGGNIERVIAAQELMKRALLVLLAGLTLIFIIVWMML